VYVFGADSIFTVRWAPYSARPTGDGLAVLDRSYLRLHPFVANTAISYFIIVLQLIDYA
jgi:hypothetical protein